MALTLVSWVQMDYQNNCHVSIFEYFVKCGYTTHGENFVIMNHHYKTPFLHDILPHFTTLYLLTIPALPACMTQLTMTILDSTTLHHTLPHYHDFTGLYHTLPHSTTPCMILLDSTILYHGYILDSTMYYIYWWI